MDAQLLFKNLFAKRAEGAAVGVYSVCSANSYVLEAAMKQAQTDGTVLLIESTANQVDQFGGYTQMTPADFREFVYQIAEQCAFPIESIVLGGDHLGPLTWKDKPEAEAMALAGDLVRSYVLAGFTKIHLDTSMHLADDDQSVALPDDVVARRGAALCLCAEAAYRERYGSDAFAGASAPVYVIGSEVPTPGGMPVEESTPTPTSVDQFLTSYDALRHTFASLGLDDAFSRVVAFVVQPGVEFSGDRIFDYQRDKAAPLCQALQSLDQALFFEAHSTDYQLPEHLKQMVEDGMIILKVGPELTYALREGLMALENIEQVMIVDSGLEPSCFSEVLERAMLADPSKWQKQYRGSPESQYLQRKFSYYDRARYYLPNAEVQVAIQVLFKNLDKLGIPPTVLRQYLPYCYDAYREGQVALEAAALLSYCVQRVLAKYAQAIRETAII